MKELKLLDLQKKANEKLVSVLKDNGKSTIRLTSVGNSIGAGYSAIRTIKPLLLRNETILQVMTNNGIHLERNHFARAQNNNDEHIFRWITSNIKQSEINKMNRNDYGNGLTSMSCPGITENGVNIYYPLDLKEDKGLKDVILETRFSLANIVIYNGCTGSFLDNVTRQGRLTEKLTYGIKRDIISLEATLKYIQANNREGSNTQVYLCGAPNFLGLHVSDFINSKLKRIASLYANVTYVEPVKSKCFYQELGKKGQFSLPKVDIHYDELEYLKFNTNIIQAINENYDVTSAMIDADRKLYKLSQNLEFQGLEATLSNNELLQVMVSKLLESTFCYLHTDLEKEQFSKEVQQYFMKRFPYDFYYLGKKNINKAIEKQFTKK